MTQNRIQSLVSTPKLLSEFEYLLSLVEILSTVNSLLPFSPPINISHAISVYGNEIPWGQNSLHPSLHLFLHRGIFSANNALYLTHASNNYLRFSSKCLLLTPSSCKPVSSVRSSITNRPRKSQNYLYRAILFHTSTSPPSSYHNQRQRPQVRVAVSPTAGPGIVYEV
jgi:hypothetical protein